MTVELTTDSPTVSVTYTPAAYGAATLSVTNDGGLADPASITFTPQSATYTLTGPSSGTVGVASTNFTVALPVGGAVSGTMTVVPNDGGAGTFTPTTVNLTTAAPSATFSYTPASAGIKTIATTNNRGLTNPGSLTYTVAAAPHLLNTLISYWKLDEVSTAAGYVPRADTVGTNTFNETVAFTSSSTGKIGNAVHMPGGGYLIATNNASLQVTGDFTFSIWGKADYTLGGGYIFAKGSDYSLYYDALASSAGVGFQFNVGAGAGTITAQVGTTNPLGTWVHIVCWYDSSDGKVRMRINDTTTYVSSTNGTLTAPTSANLGLGATGSGGSPINQALIDEIGFWKRILNAAEITALYNGGAGLPYSSFTT